MLAPVAETKPKAILFDATRCIGCGACYEACKEANELPPTADDPPADHLSYATYTVVEEHGERYVRRMCMHCLDPTCVSVCPVGAFEKLPEGPVLYHADRCMGCRYCMQACPFGVPRYEWHRTDPRVRKCMFCYTRQREGRQPACAEACPAEATIFGDRDELIAEARRRIAEDPDSYIHHIYGLEEAGGTSVLILSDVPFEELGLPTNLPNEPLPDLTWAVLAKIPRFSVLAGVFLTGVWWITNRREEVRKAEGGE